MRSNDFLYEFILESIVRSNDCFIRPYVGDYNKV
jgi:hypothetical protein